MLLFEVFKFPINSSGDISTAFSTTSQGQLPVTTVSWRNKVLTFESSPYIFILGGSDNSGTRGSAVYKGQINTTTGNISAFATTSQGQLPNISDADYAVTTANVGGTNYVYFTPYLSNATIYKATVTKVTGADSNDSDFNIHP